MSPHLTVNDEGNAPIHILDPLKDPRWVPFVEAHPDASVFHSRSWLEALARTYSYRPFVLSSAPPDRQLTNAIVFCEVSSWLTGRRIVSLPFSDHCAPLVTQSHELRALLGAAVERCRTAAIGYVELRPPGGVTGDHPYAPEHSFIWHVLDLRPDLSALFQNTHESSFRRKVKRARREGVEYERGRSDAVLQMFYSLHTSTRRRHGTPPQPLSWFRNLRDCFGERLTVAIAARKSEVLAGILLLRQGNTVVYKYGASDAQQHALGAMPALLWYAVETSKEWGATRLDLGRSDLDNAGLIRFKDRLGATSSRLTYLRFPASASRPVGVVAAKILKRIVPAMPDRAVQLVGRLVYRHLG